MKTLILIPAYNASKHLPLVVSGVRGLSERFDILVVDDGSSDGTLDALKTLGLTPLVHPKNLGKGEALKTGMRYAVYHSYDVIVTLDADMQHPPSLVPALIRPIREGLADFVIGSRERSKSSMSWARRTSNFLTSFMISRRVRTMIPDSQSGFRAMRMHFLRDMELTTSRYETETEILIKAADAGARFAFVPMPTIYAGEASSIRHVQDTLRFIRLFARML